MAFGIVLPLLPRRSRRHRTGNLVTMTSANTPAPFSSSTWQAWSGQDFQGSDNTTLNFGQRIRVLNGQGRLRTAGGSNFTIQIYLTINGIETLVRTITGVNDNNIFYFNIPSNYQSNWVTAMRVDLRGSNGGVSRYGTQLRITEWVQ